MSTWQQSLKKLTKSHFFRFGLPFLTLVVGGSFLTVDFQRIKYEARERKYGKQALEELGIDCKINIKEEYEKISKANEDHQWQNIRGPRPYEDNVEFLSLREAQEKRVRESLERGEKSTQKTLTENV